MPKLDLDSLEQINRTGYPSPWREQMAKRQTALRSAIRSGGSPVT